MWKLGLVLRGLTGAKFAWQNFPHPATKHRLPLFRIDDLWNGMLNDMLLVYTKTLHNTTIHREIFGQIKKKLRSVTPFNRFSHMLAFPGKRVDKDVTPLHSRQQARWLIYQRTPGCSEPFGRGCSDWAVGSCGFWPSPFWTRVAGLALDFWNRLWLVPFGIAVPWLDHRIERNNMCNRSGINSLIWCTNNMVAATCRPLPKRRV